VDELQALRRPRATDGPQGKPKGVDDATRSADSRQVARVRLTESISRAESQFGEEEQRRSVENVEMCVFGLVGAIIFFSPLTLTVAIWVQL